METALSLQDVSSKSEGKSALLYTGTRLARVVEELCAEVMPEVETYDIIDESLLREAIEAGSLT